MRAQLLAALLLLVAGCASSVPEAPPGSSGPFAFVSGRVDQDGDGRFDHVNLTLIAAPEPLALDRVTFRVGEQTMAAAIVLEEDPWRPGQSALLPCEPGLHEFWVLVDGHVKKVVIHECGVQSPITPPAFEGRLVDGDADGANDAIQLTLLTGGPLDPTTLNATLGDRTLRFYDSPMKNRVVRATLNNGTRVFTPCDPEHPWLELSWQGRDLPRMRLTGCDTHAPGIDAPVVASRIDADEDGRPDGWNLSLGAPSDGPFALAAVNATWRHGNATVNGSIDLAPPPDPWGTRDSLVLPCPVSGRNALSVTVHGRLVFQIGETDCERSPGQPLLTIDTREAEGRVSALLLFSRVGPLDEANLTMPNGTPVGNGTWDVAETRPIPCPNGTLTLLYQGRLAFRGPGPC